MKASCDKSEIVATEVLTTAGERFSMMIRFVFLSEESKRGWLALLALCYLIFFYHLLFALVGLVSCLNSLKLNKYGCDVLSDVKLLFYLFKESFSQHSPN